MKGFAFLAALSLWASSVLAQCPDGNCPTGNCPTFNYPGGMLPAQPYAVPYRQAPAPQAPRAVPQPVPQASTATPIPFWETKEIGEYAKRTVVKCQMRLASGPIKGGLFSGVVVASRPSTTQTGSNVALIVTSDHPFWGPGAADAQVTVIHPDGYSVPAYIADHDRASDMCAMLIYARQDTPVAALAEQVPLGPSTRLATIGYAEGQYRSIVCRLEGYGKHPTDPAREVLYVDGRAILGESGGGVFNSYGELVGQIECCSNTTRSFHNPTARLRRYLQQLSQSKVTWACEVSYCCPLTRFAPRGYRRTAPCYPTVPVVPGGSVVGPGPSTTPPPVLPPPPDTSVGTTTPLPTLPLPPPTTTSGGPNCDTAHSELAAQIAKVQAALDRVNQLLAQQQQTAPAGNNADVLAKIAELKDAIDKAPKGGDNSGLTTQLNQLQQLLGDLKTAQVSTTNTLSQFSDTYLSNTRALAEKLAAIEAKLREGQQMVMTVQTPQFVEPTYVDVSTIWALQKNQSIEHMVLVVDSRTESWNQLSSTYRTAKAAFPPIVLVDVATKNVVVTPVPQLVIYGKDTTTAPTILKTQAEILAKLQAVSSP